MNVDKIQKVAVIGAGLMGHGIAQELAQGGYEVGLNDVTDEALEKAIVRIRDNYAMLEREGLLSQGKGEKAIGLVQTSVDIGVAIDGADLVIECSGAPPAIAQTFELVRKWGRVCAIGLTGKKPVQLDWDAAMTKNVTLFFNMSTTYASWEKTIWMVAQKKIDVDPLLTHELPLKEWEQGFAALENMEALKVVLIP